MSNTQSSEDLKKTLCEAPKELLSAYRSIAVQTTLGYLLVMGWLLTSEETQKLAKGNYLFLVGSVIGLSAFLVAAMAILYSYSRRSKLAFKKLEEFYGEDSKILECYFIKRWQWYATSVLFGLLATASIFHLFVIFWGQKGA